MSRWTYWFATGLGIGRFPIASGTVGSAAGLVLVVVIQPFPSMVYVAITLLVLGLGWYCAGQVERSEDCKDSPVIVIDEIAGMMIAAAWIPAGWGPLLLGFFIFRVFDILKPFPAGWVERHIPGGGGVMLDDVVAGIYANLAVQGIGKVFWG